MFKSNLHDLVASINEKNQLQGQCVNVAGILGGLLSQSQRTPKSLWKKRRACSYLGTLALLKRNDQCGQSMQNNLIKPVVYARLAIERNACLACLPLQGVDISWHIVPVWAEDQWLHRALTCPKPDPTASLLCQVTFWSCSSSSLALVVQFNHLTHRRARPCTLCWLCFWKSHGSRVHPTKNTWNKSKHVAKNMDKSCHLDLTPSACSIPGNCCGWICIHELMRNIEDNLSRKHLAICLSHSIGIWDVEICRDQILDSRKSHLS